jgi:pyruvate kinase
VLKASGYNALKLKHDEPHSNFAFNFNLRRCIEGYKTQGADGETRIGLSYDKLCTSLVPGNTMLLADGTISIRVDSIESATVVRGTVLNSKKLGERKNCNLPGVKVDIPVLTPKDVDDVQNFCCKNGMDFIAASFVQTGEDVLLIRKTLDDAGGGAEYIKPAMSSTACFISSFIGLSE